MNPAELAKMCVTSINSTKELGFPAEQAQILVTTPKGWKPPPKWPRGRIVQWKEDGSRVRYFPAFNLLAWLAANGFVNVQSEDRNDYRIET